MTKQSTLCALVLVFTLGVPAQAQDTLSFQLGSRIRVRGLEATLKGDRTYRYEGTVANADSTHLVIRVPGRTTLDTLPFFAMQRLDVYHGEVPRSKMVLAGAATGAAIGAGLWILTKFGEDSFKQDGVAEDPSSAKPAMVRLATIGIPVLAAVGMTIGAVSTRDFWVRVTIPGALHPDPH